MKLTQSYSRLRRQWRRLVIRLDAALKSEVEADLKALKAAVAATAGVDELTDSQIQELKDGKGEADEECTGSVH